MQTDIERQHSTSRSGRVGSWPVYLAVLVTAAGLMLVGAQFAFLVRLPHLSALVRDPQALWLVFSTWPDVRFGLFSLLLAYQFTSGHSWEVLDPRTLPGRIRGMDQRIIVAAIGVSAFLLLPVVFGFPFLLLDLMTLLFCALLGGILFKWAARAGMPMAARWMIAAFSIGFFGNLLMSDADHRAFSCRSGPVQLDSGDNLPCDTLDWLKGKPLWLVEGPQPPRLVPRGDIADSEIDRALGL
ncbi:hypothetical protein [Terrihabitans sp. B22-R8]|uniref:hypothetical protein n=1 Tax=Terrihabitans sp. B22-R8 TaxID=3425128 RepID=UPI00403D3360